MAEDLEALRSELGDIDRQLLTLIKRRQETALAIGAIKQTRGRATRDFSQESTVIARARGQAQAIGLDVKIAEELMLILINASLSAQEQDRVASAESGEGKRALIIGGAGKMGTWFARFMHSQRYAVEIADPSGPVPPFTHHTDWQNVDLSHDVIVIATPLGTSSEVLSLLSEKKPTGIVFDVGSLKSPLRKSLRELAAQGVSVTSVHPMFGPDTNMLSGRHVIFIDLGCAQATKLAKELFSSTMATLVDMDLESHDRLIAYVLGLSHALNLAFVTALAESGETAPRLADLSSTTFDAQLDLACKVASENPKLYFEIQNLNDYGSEALSALLYSVERIRSLVRAGDEAGFVALMEKSAAYLKQRSGT